MRNRLLLVALAWLMIMCSSDEPATPGHVKFVLLASQLPGGPTSVEEFDEVIITIERPSHEVVYDGKIAIALFSESYVSEQLRLNDGEYFITKFILAKSDVAKYECPRVGSPKGPLVRYPLPLPFHVRPNDMANLGIDVVAL